MRRLLLALVPVVLIGAAPAEAARAALEVDPGKGAVGTQVTLRYVYADPADACPGSYAQFLIDDVAISTAPLVANGCTSTLVTQVPQTTCRNHYFQAYIPDGAPQSSLPGSEAAAPFRVLCPTASPSPRPSRPTSRPPGPSAAPGSAPPSATARTTPVPTPVPTPDASGASTSPTPVLTEPPAAAGHEDSGVPLWPWLAGGALLMLGLAAFARRRLPRNSAPS